MKTFNLSGRPSVKSKSAKTKHKDTSKDKGRVAEIAKDTRELPELRELGIRTFDKEYLKLMKQLKAEEFSGNQSSYAMLRAQLAMIVQMMPEVEKVFYKYPNERAVYATVALSNHAREIAHDLRTFGDQSEMRDRIHNLVIRKLLGAMATKITQEVIATRRDLHVEFPGKVGRAIEKRLDRLQKSIIENVQGVDSDGLDMLTKILQVR